MHCELDLWPFDLKIHRAHPWFMMIGVKGKLLCAGNPNADDRRTDGQTDMVIPVYPPNFVAGGIIKIFRHGIAKCVRYWLMRGWCRCCKNREEISTDLNKRLCVFTYYSHWGGQHLIFRQGQCQKVKKGKIEVPRDVRISEGPYTWQVQESMVSTFEQMQVPNGTRPGVRRSKRPRWLAAPVEMFYGNLQNLVIRSKSVIKSSSVISSQVGVMSDQLRVSFYMIMS